MFSTRPRRVQGEGRSTPGCPTPACPDRCLDRAGRRRSSRERKESGTPRPSPVRSRPAGLLAAELRWSAVLADPPYLCFPRIRRPAPPGSPGSCPTIPLAQGRGSPSGASPPRSGVRRGHDDAARTGDPVSVRVRDPDWVALLTPDMRTRPCGARQCCRPAAALQQTLRAGGPPRPSGRALPRRRRTRCADPR